MEMWQWIVGIFVTLIALGALGLSLYLFITPEVTPIETAEEGIGINTVPAANQSLHVHGARAAPNGEVARFTTDRGDSTIGLDCLVGTAGAIWDVKNSNNGHGLEWHMDGSEKMRLDTSGNLNVTGALSKGSGSFDIPHVIPSKREKGYRLRHYFVESNTAGDNMYRYHIEVKEDSFEIDLPDYFHPLNDNVQVWVNADKHFGQGYGEVSGEQLIIKTTAPGRYYVLVIGTRKDDIAMADFKKHGVEYVKDIKDNK